MIRFIHTADWQIGKPFGGFDAEKRGELRAERFAAVARIAELARIKDCAAVLVAGDVFDDNTVADRDIARTLDAMSGFAGPWVLLPGNHDAALPVSVWTRLRAGGALPSGVIIADTHEAIDLPAAGLSILPAPLTRRHEGQDLTLGFDTLATPPGHARVGLAHGAVANRLPEKAESANPIAEDRAERARLDYLALGDWHGFLNIAPRTYYSGTPEPDRYPANQPGHVAFVELEGPGAAPQVTQLATARFRWVNMSLALHGDIAPLDEAFGAFESPLRSLVNLTLAGSLGLEARVALEGRLAHWASNLFDLRVDDAELFDQPDEDDFDRISVSGFVRSAMEALRRQAADPADPERDAAALALRMAYVEHMRSRGG